MPAECVPKQVIAEFMDDDTTKAVLKTTTYNRQTTTTVTVEKSSQGKVYTFQSFMRSYMYLLWVATCTKSLLNALL